MFGFIGMGVVELLLVGGVMAALVGGLWWVFSTTTQIRMPTKCPHCGKDISG